MGVRQHPPPGERGSAGKAGVGFLRGGLAGSPGRALMPYRTAGEFVGALRARRDAAFIRLQEPLVYKHALAPINI